MPSCRLWRHAAWVACVVLSAVSCASPERIEPTRFRDDFGRDLGEEMITERSVNETQMLRRRAAVELRTIGGFPIDGIGGSSDLTPLAGTGFKANYEVQKDIFMGLSFDWGRFGIDKDDLSDPEVLRSAGALQRYEYVDRYNVMLTFDQDIILARNFIKDDSPFAFRWGIAPGAFFALGPERRGLTGDLELFANFVFRTEVSFRWQVCPYSTISLGAGVDWVPRDNVEVNLGNDRRKVSGKVDFSTVNLIGGLQLQW